MVNSKFALALRDALRYSTCGWLTLALIWSMPAAANFESGLSAYERGDYAAAMTRWMPLAKSGFAAAQHNIAVMFDHGHGVPPDDAVAISWYKRAANGGHAPSRKFDSPEIQSRLLGRHHTCSPSTPESPLANLIPEERQQVAWGRPRSALYHNTG